MISDAKSFAIKMYSFNSKKNKKVINKEFNRLHKEKKMLRIKKFIVYNYSMFVI